MIRERKSWDKNIKIVLNLLIFLMVDYMELLMQILVYVILKKRYSPNKGNVYLFNIGHRNRSRNGDNASNGDIYPCIIRVIAHYDDSCTRLYAHYILLYSLVKVKKEDKHNRIMFILWFSRNSAYHPNDNILILGKVSLKYNTNTRIYKDDHIYFIMVKV